MNIQEATKRALEIDGYITGGSLNIGKNFLFIKPTDGPNLCILCAGENHARRGWQPHAKDLISDDWDVISKENVSILLKQEVLYEE